MTTNLYLWFVLSNDAMEKHLFVFKRIKYLSEHYLYTRDPHNLKFDYKISSKIKNYYNDFQNIYLSHTG